MWCTISLKKEVYLFLRAINFPIMKYTFYSNIKEYLENRKISPIILLPFNLVYTQMLICKIIITLYLHLGVFLFHSTIIPQTFLFLHNFHVNAFEELHNIPFDVPLST